MKKLTTYSSSNCYVYPGLLLLLLHTKTFFFLSDFLLLWFEYILFSAHVSTHAHTRFFMMNSCVGEFLFFFSRLIQTRSFFCFVCLFLSFVTFFFSHSLYTTLTKVNKNLVRTGSSKRIPTRPFSVLTIEIDKRKRKKHTKQNIQQTKS